MYGWFLDDDAAPPYAGAVEAVPARLRDRWSERLVVLWLHLVRAILYVAVPLGTALSVAHHHF